MGDILKTQNIVEADCDKECYIKSGNRNWVHVSSFVPLIGPRGKIGVYLIDPARGGE